MKFLLRIFSILRVVPDPHIGSRTRSFSFDHDPIWSAANFSGNIAGCLKAYLSDVVFPLPVAYSQMLYRVPRIATSVFFLVVSNPFFFSHGYFAVGRSASIFILTIRDEIDGFRLAFAENKHIFKSISITIGVRNRPAGLAINHYIVNIETNRLKIKTLPKRI